MSVIMVGGRKGGVTKSECARNLAAAFQRMGRRTVLIDADGQGNATERMGAAPYAGFYGWIGQDAELADVLTPIKPQFAASDGGDLWIIGGNDATAAIEHDKETPARIIERVDELKAWADVVIVDTSPGISEIHNGFYFASDLVLLPTLCEISSVQSLRSTLAYIENAQKFGAQSGRPVAQVVGIAPNRYKNETVQNVNFGILQGRYEGKLEIFQPIHEATVWNKAANANRSIYAMLDWKHDDRALVRAQARVAVRQFQPIVDALAARMGIAIA